MSNKHTFQDAYHERYNVTWQVLSRYCIEMLILINTPRSLAIKAYIERVDQIDLTIGLFKVNPHVYGRNSYLYLLDSQAVALIKKLAQLPTGVDTKEAALKSFLDRERINRSYNRKLKGLVANDEFLSRVFQHARFFLATLLGSYEHKIDLMFGPGSTLDLRGSNATLTGKIETEPTVTPGCLLRLSGDVHTFPMLSAWVNRRVNVCNHSELAFVPKDATKDRVIAFEPTVNTVYQRNIGIQLRDKLNKLYCLRTAPEVHHKLAYLASRDGLMATIDFKDASNSLYYALVRALFPPDWFLAMDASRVHYTKLPNGSLHELEMFSSNGNGFTFEMETLLFLALGKGVSRASCKEDSISVFGDDVIIASDVAELYMTTCEKIGLFVNDAKSFTSGFFRESCGRDFICGYLVRPIYLKKFAPGILGLYQLHNRFWEIEDLLGLTHLVSANIALRIPKRYRFYGLPHYLDALRPKESYSSRVSTSDVILKTDKPVDTFYIEYRQKPGSEVAQIHRATTNTGILGYKGLKVAEVRYKPPLSYLGLWCYIYIGGSSFGSYRRATQFERPRVSEKTYVLSYNSTLI